MNGSTKNFDEFVMGVRSVLETVVNNLGSINPKLDAAFVELVKTSWHETEDSFRGMQAYFGKPEFESGLKGKGMTGASQELKLKVFRDEKAAFQEIFAAYKTDRSGWNPFATILREVLKRLFSIIDTILGSLGFVPGSEAVKEFKEVLEKVIEKQ